MEFPSSHISMSNCLCVCHCTLSVFSFVLYCSIENKLHSLILVRTRRNAEMGLLWLFFEMTLTTSIKRVRHVAFHLPLIVSIIFVLRCCRKPTCHPHTVTAWNMASCVTSAVTRRRPATGNVSLILLSRCVAAEITTCRPLIQVSYSNFPFER